MNRTDLRELKLLCESILLNEGVVKELDSRTFEDRIEDIVNVENQAFNDPAPDWDLLDDSKQPGYIGFCGMDNNGSIISYIYGFDARDQMEEIEELTLHEDEVSFFNHYTMDEAKVMVSEMNTDNTFYVSNFASSKDNADQIIVGKMLIEFFNKLKQSGIKYLIFDGRKDTMRLILGDSRNPNILNVRQKRYGFKLVATVYDGESHLSLITI